LANENGKLVLLVTCDWQGPPILPTAFGTLFNARRILPYFFFDNGMINSKAYTISAINSTAVMTMDKLSTN